MDDNVMQAETDAVGFMLSRLSGLWKSRAAVNAGLCDFSVLEFDASRSDFSEQLLPFKNHQAWKDADVEIKSKCLSYAWIIYNLKTIYIETNVVAPACEDIIKAPPASSCNRAVLQSVMVESLLDEALHTKMSVDACNYIYAMRGIEFLDFTDFNLVAWRNALLATCSAEWERRLTRFGIACASETLITDYLKVMAEDSSIQKICHEVTSTHARDEWSHSSVFSFAASDILRGLSERERAYFKSVVLKTVDMFANNELGAWKAAFSIVGLPGADAILHDTGDNNEVGVYVESVEKLIDRVGLNSPAVVRSQAFNSAMG
ncbi:diiron oxygenase [Pseudomonas sp. BJa5]|uniref:diiron oxygenase n=1 Tax=Pseudomonas sp. BJa5 TaxID=2936270 RepID=UPI00255A0A55|nr:diiron oxygenase [Pseudomonas sp. BGr12]MDL2424241.1 diiron oxygenase [Pseudomonas sp. BGr12]